MNHSTRLAHSAVRDRASTASNPSIEVYRAIRAHEIMLNQATSALEHATAAPLVLLNGGAAVAYLTLLGAISDPEKSKLGFTAAWAVTALVAWALGLIAAQLAVTFGLISQRAYAKAQRLKRQGVERLLLSGNPQLLSVVVPSFDERTVQSREEGEKAELAYGARTKWRFDAARAVSSVFFLGGVACAAVSLG